MAVWKGLRGRMMYDPRDDPEAIEELRRWKEERKKMEDRDMEKCDVRDATHVKVRGDMKRIRSKWGIDKGVLAPPSKGGFGVITEEGEVVDMWTAEEYCRVILVEGKDY
jgi:hypothetical protein